ncbi:hypothetical protein CRE_19912 [Caenorhabditis remanei]|uniref:Uncharacterized protein n=1 Tax=Caenorhabditis remanei TaxID=31234 RepID=E3N2Y3_CAERE|nr:hypothetical protein CRE_19912 [Caenorhabditis remanei]
MQLDLPSIVVSSHSDDTGSNSRNDRASPALLNPLMPLMMTQMAFSQRKCREDYLQTGPKRADSGRKYGKFL